MMLITKKEPQAFCKCLIPALFAGIPLLSGQGTSSSDAEEEIYELSPFVVDASQDSGYRATNSLAGSRLKTDLKDIGAAISVVTKDFMDDIGATDLNKVFLYTTGTEAAGLEGNFSGASVSAGSRRNSDEVVNNPGNALRIRGLGAPDTTRGYFLTSIPFDSYNSSRLDVSRGANSILFGLGSPAGVVNSSIYQANTNKDRGEFRFRVGSGSEDHLSYRTEIDYNKVLIKDKLGVRISGLQEDRKFRQDPAYRDTSRIYLAATAHPWENGTFRINHERGDITSNNPDPVSPTENITSYVEELDRLHSLIAEYGPRSGIPSSWDPYNPPIIGDIFAEAIKLNSGKTQNGVFYEPLYRRPHLAVDASAGYGNPIHGRAVNIYRNGVVVYDGPNSTTPDAAFIGQVRNKPFEAGDAAAYAAYGGAPEGYTVPGNKIGWASMMGVQNVGQTQPNHWLYPTVTDLGLYDFTRHLIAGTAGRQYKEFDATSLSWEQTFFDNNVGFELSFYDERYEDFNANPFRNNNASINVDIQKTLPIGGENPNFGRPYVVDRISINNRFDDRKATRFTAFARYDFEERMFQDSFLGKVLGEHTLTGLYAEDERDELRYNQNENWISDDPEIQEYLGDVMGTKPFQRQVAYMTYLGPAVDLLSDPGSITLEDFKINSSAIVNQIIPDTGGTQAITFWKDGALTDIPLRRAPYIRGGRLSNVNVESNAVVLQSRWLDDSIVTILGHREDTRTELLNTPPPNDPNDPNNEGLTVGTGNATVDPVHFNLQTNAFGEPIAPNIQDAETSSLSIVARLPQSWRKGFFAENDISLFYSKSDNTSAGAIRLDAWYNPIGQPSGETEEFGIHATLLEGKLSIRANKFESSIVNGYTNRSRLSRMIGNNALKAIQDSIKTYLDIGDDFDELEDDPGSQYFGQPLYPNYDQTEPYINGIAALFGASIDLDNKTISLDESHPMANTWKASLAQLTLDANGELTGNGWFHRTPPNLNDTQDIVSKGLETEIIFNPTNNWRMMLNVTRTQTESSNSVPHTGALIELWEPVMWGNRETGELSFVGGHRIETAKRLTPGDEWNLTSFQWDKWVKGHYNATKALDGQKNPEEREWRANFITNYNFTEGRFKGFSVGGSIRWQDVVAIGYPLIEVGDESVPDVSNPYMGPDEINYGLRFGYQRKLGDRINWNISLNLDNVTSDQEKLIPVGAQPDGTIAVVRTPAPRAFSLTNTFKF